MSSIGQNTQNPAVSEAHSAASSASASRSGGGPPHASAVPPVPPRIQKELSMLARDPGPGISAWPASPGATHELMGQIVGPEDSPYRGGTFSISISLPQRYPFEPPSVRFITPIYHPNIDSEGRICLDTLKMQPQGSWSPSININTLLLTIRVLMANPNANDGLVASITEQYRRNVEEFNRCAREHTLQHAMQPTAAPTAAVGPSGGAAVAPSSVDGLSRPVASREGGAIKRGNESNDSSTSSSSEGSDGSSSGSDEDDSGDESSSASSTSNSGKYSSNSGPVKRLKLK